jgi:spermidine synthase
MVIELVAGRIVSRHLGASIYTWTSVIGVILGGLAAGNYVGGRLADRFPPRPTLGVLFLLSSATSVAILVGDNLVARWGALWGLSWPTRVAAHVALVFFLPAALLGTIGPVVARRALELGQGTGRTLGSVYAWGVLGSLAGTFLTGYVLFDWMGTATIVWSVAGVTALVGVLHLPRSPIAWGFSATMFLAFALAHGAGPRAVALGEALALREPADPTVIYRDESRYCRVEVRGTPRSDVRGMYLDKLLHSRVSMGDPLRAHYGYIAIFARLTRLYAAPGPRLDTLTIGGGGYVFPRWLEAGWPEGRTEVVEIDEAVTRAAREAFGLSATSAIRTVHADGRAFVNHAAEARRRGEPVPSYDFVYLDAVNDYSVPYQLTTVEFFRNIRELLEPGGVVLVNSIDTLESGRFVGALAGTLEQVFAHVTVHTLDRAERMRGDSRLTFVLAASDRPPVSRGAPARVADAVLERYRDGGVPFLTDSYAPVEQLVAPVVRASAREVGARDALARALSLERRGDHEGSLRLCRRALQLDPDLAEAHYTLAGGLYAQGRVDEAIDGWRRAIAAHADYAEAHFNLGAALYERGDLDGAWVHLGKAMRLAPGMAEAASAAGVVLEARGDLEGAARLYEQALRLDPASADARRHLDRVRAVAGRAVEPPPPPHGTL